MTVQDFILNLVNLLASLMLIPFLPMARLKFSSVTIASATLSFLFYVHVNTMVL